MAKTFFLALSFAVLASAAQAQTAPDAPRDPAVAAKGQDYWLSNGLNKLVFWKAPMQSGRSVATEPAKR